MSPLLLEKIQLCSLLNQKKDFNVFNSLKACGPQKCYTGFKRVTKSVVLMKMDQFNYLLLQTVLL